MSKTSKPDVRFMVAVKQHRDSHSINVELTPVIVTSEGMRNPSWRSYGEDHATQHLDSITIHALADTTEEGGPRLFGWEVEYRSPYSVSADYARAMVATLTRAEKAVSKHQAQYGYPQDFAAYATIVARALGAHDAHPFGRQLDTPGRGYGWRWDDHDYRWMDTDALRYHLADALKPAETRAA